MLGGSGLRYPRAVPGMTRPMEAQLAQDPNGFAQDLFDGLPQRYDALAEVLSFGQNARWRRAMVDRIVDSRPTHVLDVATGTAGVALQVADRTGARVVGVDLTEAMLREGARRVHRAEAQQHIALALGRAEQLPFPDETFDALTFTYLLRYVDDPSATLRELARVLQPGAPMASLDFAVPTNPIWSGSWWAYTRALLPLGGAVGGRDWVRVGRFLGPNISSFYARHPVSSVVAAWRAAGMTGVGVQTMSLGGGLVMWGRKGQDRTSDDRA
jgi:demethylmenaquinone methyltransferase/2-methoxy-6-polyprenyl-1,4-benzoquinol methylase